MCRPQVQQTKIQFASCTLLIMYHHYVLLYTLTLIIILSYIKYHNYNMFMWFAQQPDLGNSLCSQSSLCIIGWHFQYVRLRPPKLSLQVSMQSFSFRLSQTVFIHHRLQVARTKLNYNQSNSPPLALSPHRWYDRNLRYCTNFKLNPIEWVLPAHLHYKMTFMGYAWVHCVSSYAHFKFQGRWGSQSLWVPPPPGRRSTRHTCYFCDAFLC